MENNSSVAVFIDVENIHYSTLNNFSETPNWSRIVDVCKKYGRISSIQAFGDWIEFAKEIPEIQNNGIQPVFVPLSQSGKSSLDCYLTVSAMKLFFQNSSIDTLILASGDRDYIPLIAELKALGKKIIIMAIPGTLSTDLIKIADELIYYEQHYDELADSRNDKIAKNQYDIDKIKKDVIEAIGELESNSINDRWVNLAHIGLSLKNKYSRFSHTNLGYNKLVEFLNDIEGIEIKYDNFEKTIALARTCAEGCEDLTDAVFEGTVLRLKDGYGFIKPNESSENIFFHNSKLLNVKFWELNEGDKVQYTTYNTERGLNAENIELVS